MGTCGKIFGNFIINSQNFQMLFCKLNVNFKNI